jgi:hypothetical protein
MPHMRCGHVRQRYSTSTTMIYVAQVVQHEAQHHPIQARLIYFSPVHLQATLLKRLDHQRGHLPEEGTRNHGVNGARKRKREVEREKRRADIVRGGVILVRSSAQGSGW